MHYLGTIECVVVLPNTTEIQLPTAITNDAATVQRDRIGYVFVQFSQDLHSVELLGFSDRVDTEYISIDCLQSLDELLDLIDTARINNLQEFLLGILGNGWQPLANSILSPQQEYALRNTISLPKNTSYDSIRDFTASKMINLRANIANIPLLLPIGLNEELDGRFKVRIRLHAAGGIPLLPAHLKLTLQREIQESLFVSSGFISKWTQIYTLEGLSALKLAHKGATGYLKIEQRKAILEWLKVKNYWNLGELKAYVEEQYEVVFSSENATTLQGLFKSLFVQATYPNFLSNFSL
ncbi:DUF1822 family protein [Chamaesiphon minutus]|uniref:Uncharacterized protein n=1 Tax=Chamaesiphon minutus (strain ATCC 27169 / PCC 6605) TaxID=1173020 RepID=K9UCK9_CHAP6|nr:DUF1822 family protein [Chamaesiphon minutus]AFY91944.1 Protein of unknown function (DUF1822) [Chamaesiphon minutus PCC 6605]